MSEPSRPGPPTLRDVASRAGVHPATASRALNPQLPGRISPDTTRKVEEAARALGYTPDPTARSLRTRRSGVVGVIVPDLINPVLPPIVRGIEETLWQAGLACLLADTDNRPEREAAFVEEMRARRCEGLVVATATRGSEAVRGLGDGLPAVLVTRETDDQALPFVGGDDDAGVRAAVDHLASLGHSEIAYVTGPPELTTTVRREAAFRSAIEHHRPGQDPVVVHGSGFTTPAGKKGALEVLQGGRVPTAILAGNDMMALGVYESLGEAGLRCPEDVSVVGHNDMPFMGQISPPLTTVSIPQYQVGVEAAQMLLSLLEGTPPDPRRRLLPIRLTVRGSTGPPRGSVAH